MLPAALSASRRHASAGHSLRAPPLVRSGRSWDTAWFASEPQLQPPPPGYNGNFRHSRVLPQKPTKWETRPSGKLPQRPYSVRYAAWGPLALRARVPLVHAVGSGPQGHCLRRPNDRCTPPAVALLLLGTARTTRRSRVMRLATTSRQACACALTSTALVTVAPQYLIPPASPTYLSYLALSRLAP